jgi:hypothetical protein
VGCFISERAGAETGGAEQWPVGLGACGFGKVAGGRRRIRRRGTGREMDFGDLDGTARELAASRGPPRAYRVLSPLQVFLQEAASEVPWTMDSREQTVGARGVGATFSGILH